MTKTQVLDLLKENRDARGEANWQAVGDRTGGLSSFGIGLTKLRAIAKQVGRDHDLALTLWNERNHDAKIIGLLIDDPKELIRDQVEKQVDGAGLRDQILFLRAFHTFRKMRLRYSSHTGTKQTAVKLIE